MQTHVYYGNIHTFLWTMGRMLTLLDMIKAKEFASNMIFVSGALAYDNPTSAKTVIIVIHQAIYVPTLNCNLICPLQVIMNDVKLDDKPKSLTEAPTNESHAISCEDITGTLINITLELKGVTSYFPTRKPTKHDFDNCPRIELTDLTLNGILTQPHSRKRKKPSWIAMEDYMNGAVREAVLPDTFQYLIQC